jgi:hypothetical protein
MNAFVRPGLAVIGVAVLMTPSAPEGSGPRAAQSAVALSAHSQTLPATSSGPSALGRQAEFHINLLVDFVVTGAQLTGRIVAVPGTLRQHVDGGTPLPVAIGRGLVEFADIEFDAGRELVGYAEGWAEFQIEFLTDLIAELPAILTEGPGGQFVTATLKLASEIVDNAAEIARGVITTAENIVHDALDPPAATATLSQTTESSVVAARTTHDTSPAASENSARSDTRDDDSARSAVEAENADATRGDEADIDTTVTAQGEVRGTAQSTDGDDADTTPTDGAEQEARSDTEKPKDRADTADAAEDTNSDSGSDEG